MKHLFSYLIGNSSEISLTHRISNAILLLSVLFGVQATVGNIMLGLPIISIYASILAGLLLLLLYYISRFKNKRELAVILALSINLIFYVPVMWIGNGGSNGGMVYYSFLYAGFIMSVLDGKKSFFFVFLYIIISFTLYILEYNHYIKIYDYNTEFDRLVDIIISFTFVIIGISTTIHIYKTQYQQSNNKLSEKNIKLNQLIKRITSQRNEIEAQRDEIATQRDRLSEQNKIISYQNENIKDSINYAKKIQNAVLPNKSFINKILSEYFLIYKPKDVVSGDFYWVSKINNFQIVIVSDCTGHGVPGGFMSMLGVSFLNEIVNKNKTTKASNILNELRKHIIEALKQHGNIGEQSDGMDLSVCVINTNTNELNYAGANNPIYIVSKNNLIKQNPDRIVEFECVENDISNKLYQVLPDRMPISYYVKMNDFTDITIKLNENDCIYMMSDGFADQFGGNKGRKYGVKRFRKTILKNSCKNLDEQQISFVQELELWQGNYEQTDDITLMAFKVKN